MQEIILCWHSLVSAFVKHFQDDMASPTQQDLPIPIRVHGEPRDIYLA